MQRKNQAEDGRRDKQKRAAPEISDRGRDEEQDSKIERGVILDIPEEKLAPSGDEHKTSEEQGIHRALEQYACQPQHRGETAESENNAYVAHGGDIGLPSGPGIHDLEHAPIQVAGERFVGEQAGYFTPRLYFRNPARDETPVSKKEHLFPRRPEQKREKDEHEPPRQDVPSAEEGGGRRLSRMQPCSLSPR